MGPVPPWDHDSEANFTEKGQPPKPHSKCCGCLPTFQNVKSWSKRKKFAMAAVILLPIVALVVGLSAGLTINHSHSSSISSPPDNTTWGGPPPSQGQNRTANSDALTTWWHNTGEINPSGAVSNENVRQSHLYTVQVASSTSADDFFNSFVYETIPRSGKGKACHPDDPTITCDGEDGISIESDIGVTMAWSQFLYGSDTVVKVAKRDQSPIAASNVTIRPTHLDFHMRESNGSVLISVPYTPESHGVRFSVEFDEDLWEYRNLNGGNISHYVQNLNSSGADYVENYTQDMPIVGREPRNALLIFASPMPGNGTAPPSNSDDVHEVEPGLVQGLESISNSIVVFKPGVYYCTGEAHMNLSSTVSRVYFSPGSYVKGAIEYNNAKDPLIANGIGVLSGEQYVYQANMAQGYSNNKSDENSVKMWRGRGVTAKQSWTLNGVTMNAAPFNSMDFYGQTDNFTIDVADYKMVGSFYTQTDGLQMYPNSHVRDIFYHSGDDTVKTYYSNILAERVVVWKTNNGPVIQMGWSPRNITNVTIDTLDVIHSRYNSKLEYAPRTLIGSSSAYNNVTATDTANLDSSIANYTVRNIRGEGISPNLISLNMLSNYDNMVVENAWIEELTPDTVGISTSTLHAFTDSDGNEISMGGKYSQYGLDLKNYTVGTDRISFGLQNWISSLTGGFWVDGNFGGKWNIE